MNDKEKTSDVFYRKFKAFFVDGLFPETSGLPDGRILLAVSGGLDSVVMTELFRMSGLVYGVAHVNFQLRGAESDGDEAFVKALAYQHQVDFFSVGMETKQEVIDSGESVQMVARRLRYDWLNRMAEEQGFAYVATAHHQDDVLETLLLNLTRGTGLAGLRSIPIRRDRLIRPLWFAAREEIERFACEKKLRWRNDTSNASMYYRRNRLRHQVIPVLKELNPKLTTAVQSMVERLRAVELLIGEELNQSWTSVTEVRPNEWIISIDKLIRLSEWPFRLAEWLKEFGFSYEQSRLVADAVRGGFGQVFLSSTHRILRDRDQLVIQGWQEEPNDIVWVDSSMAGEFSVGNRFRLRMDSFLASDSFVVPTESSVVCLDVDQIQGLLRVRRWQAGDRFQPLGMKGSQKVSDFLTNRKIPLVERASTYVLVDEESIIWLIGYRLADRYRVTEQTHRILKLEWVLV